jgi:hypothetical protein
LSTSPRIAAPIGDTLRGDWRDTSDRRSIPIGHGCFAKQGRPHRSVVAVPKNSLGDGHLGGLSDMPRKAGERLTNGRTPGRE